MLTTLGAILPGIAFIAAGRRRLGAVTLSAALLVAAGGLWLGTGGRRTALHAVVSPTALTRIGIGLLILGLVWAIIVAAGYRMVRLPNGTTGQRTIGALLATLLCLLVAAPPAAAARYAFVQRDLITTVFGDNTKSATRPKTVTKANPWAGHERVNLLLLGSDAGKGRTGARTDSVIVASINTKTGDTVLFSLPRNLEKLPFPAGPLRDAYPNGYDAPGNEGEQLLNAVYNNVPIAHPHILGPTDNLGADVLKLGVGEALGLKIDYFLMINLQGFAELINAVGGVTVNINEWVPIGGSETSLPSTYLKPGPNQHLNGGVSLWYARGRFGSTDYARMRRQRCVIGAVIKSADPVTVLRRYKQLAEATKDLVRTDIPQDLLSSFVDLSMTIKKGTVKSLVFDNHIITSSNPDYDLIRAKVREALNPAPPAAVSSTAPSPAAGSRASPQPHTSPGVAEGLGSSCSYDPLLAQRALLQGEPPTRRR
ncbi:MAG: LCP family protein [Mycobacteriales bacterium]